MNLHQAVLKLNGDDDVQWELEGIQQTRFTIIFRGADLDAMLYRVNDVLRSFTVIPNPAAKPAARAGYLETAQKMLWDIRCLIHQQGKDGDVATGGNICSSWELYTMPDVLADRIYKV